MPPVLVVMLIWGGAINGGPTTITGFGTLETCKAAIQDVVDGYDRLYYAQIQATCVALRK